MGKTNTGLDKFDLTPRELEVLELLREGMSNREIAAKLIISDKTASVHVSRILAKLSVANRASAGVLAQRLGAPATRSDSAGDATAPRSSGPQAT